MTPRSTAKTWGAEMRKTDDERFAEAQKIPVADYPDTDALYVRGGPPSLCFIDDEEGTGFYANLEDLKDSFRQVGRPLPTYAWSCFKDVPSSDVTWVIEDALQDHHSNAKDFITREHQEKLDAFLKQWWKESGTFTWRPDYRKAVTFGDGT